MLLVAAVLAHAASAADSSGSTFTAKELSQGYRDGTVIAKPRREHMGSVDADEAAENLTVRKKFSRMGALRVLGLTEGDTTEAAVRRLRATGRYEFVEPDYIKHARATPNNPLFPQQWALQNTGANGPGNGIAGADIGATQAWNTIHDAPNVIVAVLDSGGLLTHQDLLANFWKNPQENVDGFGAVNDLNGINATVSQTVNTGTRSKPVLVANTAFGSPNDDNGHGTHTSGILGAVGGSGVDTTGVAWKVQIMEVKFLDSTGSGSTSAEITGIDFAISHGANFISASFGSSSSSLAEQAAIQAAGAAGIVMVVAAGNATQNNDFEPNYPANYPLDNIIAVGSSDNRDQPSSFSDFGPGSVDLFAPGDDILSLYNTSNTATAILSGTSMATPMVTGSLALLKAQFPGDSYRQLINRLLRSVDTKASFAGLVQTGGRLNLQKAVTSTNNTPFNDSFASRAALTGPDLVIRTNNAGATLEAGEPGIASTPGGASLWWEWTASQTGQVALTTTGSAYVPLVAVYTGTALNALTPVAASASGQASFAVQAGAKYELTVQGPNGASGATILSFAVTPANDAFSTPTVLPARTALLTDVNVNATVQAGEPKILPNSGGHSLWYSWKAPQSGTFQVSAYSADFDPLIGVYTGSAITGLTSVVAASGSSINTNDLTPTSAATASFSAVAGTTYTFLADGRTDSNTGLGAGQFTLSLDDALWQAATGDSVTCTPAVATDGTVYVGSDDGDLYAFTAGGTVKWKFAAGGFDTSAAAVGDDGTVYAGSDDGSLYALTAAGALKWKYTVPTPSDPTLANAIASSPAIAADGSIYFKAEDNNLYALTAAGALKWTAAVPGASYAAPAIGADGTIYVGSDAGVFSAFTPAGAVKWTFAADGAIYASAAIDAGGNLYFASLNGTVYSLNSGGGQRWAFHAANSVTSSPTLGANGLLYFGCYDGQLYALSAGNGALAWTFATGAQIRASTPAIDANGVVYIGSYDKNVYAINANGTLNRTYPTDDAVRSSPVIAGTTLYFGSNDHRVYAFAVGTASASTPWPMYQVNARHLGRIGSGP
jgi:outer membrane protein assembly factor BamB/subtilisin family serine protease